MSPSLNATWLVVLAGGVGSRFWPRSRRAHPKQCLRLYGERSLLGHTLARVSSLVPPERTLVVTGPDMAEAVRAEAPGCTVLVEPSGRNTAPAITWAAVEVERRGGEVMVVLPADHRIEAESAFREVLRAALEAASRRRLVLLGITPTHPHTGYGYIVPDDVLPSARGHRVLEVQRFAEKPDRAGAERLLAAGALWNSGMFVWRVDAFLDAVRSSLPDTHAALTGEAPVEEAWPHTDATSVDFGILEHSDALAVIPCTIGWSDLGSWTALEALLPGSPLGAADAAAGVAIDGGGHIVYAPGKLVATIGVSDLIVVDTPDALLVCPRDQAQRVGEVLAALRARGEKRWQ